MNLIRKALAHLLPTHRRIHVPACDTLPGDLLVMNGHRTAFHPTPVGNYGITVDRPR